MNSAIKNSNKNIIMMNTADKHIPTLWPSYLYQSFLNTDLVNRPRFNIKTVFPCMDPHVEDKTVSLIFNMGILNK